MATPHINAADGAFAETVLMPGDPLRAQYIAENFLENAELVTDVRNMFGYTGTYKGKKVSVMGHGMGIPSCSIYVHELIKDYGVKNVIRVGSCGAVKDDVKLMDVIVAQGASTDSKVNRTRFADHDFAAICDFHLMELPLVKRVNKTSLCALVTYSLRISFTAQKPICSTKWTNLAFLPLIWKQRVSTVSLQS